MTELRVTGVLLGLVALGCETGNGVGLVGEIQGGDMKGTEVELDVVVPDEKAEGRQVEGQAGDTALDFQEDQWPVSAVGKGSFLDRCTDNKECESGWCVEHMGEGVCSMLCQEECPPGWVCKQVGGVGPDIVWACVSRHANLCRPCVTGADCKSVGGAEDVCVAYGPEGSFCGGACEADEDCPWGFRCENVETVDGVGTRQCVSETGSCPCTAKSIALGLWTKCEVENEWGTCSGKRVCTEEGLSPCDAPEPALEECNGIDDDCDGAIDEPREVGGKFESLCDDGNECTEDKCAGESGCQHVALDGVECKDGDVCTVADHCVAGVCIGDPVVCDDGNPCTDNLCTPTGGCEFVPNLAKCDDGDPCTVDDDCENGICTGFPVPCDCKVDEDCAALEDGDVCNGTLVCDTSKVPYRCVVKEGSEVVCPEPEGINAPCLKATCDPVSGKCSMVPGPNGTPCEDGNACTIGDVCMNGKCTAGAAANCNDGNPCTSDWCDPQAGCMHTFNSLPCNDGNACTTNDICVDGECIGGSPLECDDGNVCTVDSCDPVSGCKHTPNEDPCEDGNKCTQSDTCVGGQCMPGPLLDCDDKNPCTSDYCLPQLGCLHAVNNEPCSDGDPCTVNDMCANGVCNPGPKADCDDANPCTDDSCGAQGTCVHTFNEAPCDDGNACTIADQCKAGKCTSSLMKNCDDENPCTTDSCDPTVGCVFVPNLLPCDDGDVCTLTDRCDMGICKGTGELMCDDGNPCTQDYCDPEAGCVFMLTEVPCCLGSTTKCGDKCVDTQVDPLNCGGCGNECGPGQICQQGECVLSCPEEQTDCAGKCTNTSFDPANCGQCGNICPGAEHAIAVCLDSKCYMVCMEGFADCNAKMADGCETNLNTSILNCGACGHACKGGANTLLDCEDGVCVVSCQEGFGDCNNNMSDGCETDLTNTVKHCGQCGKECLAAAHQLAMCENSQCKVSCEQNWDDCDKDPSNGCETDLLTDKNNCGKCGHACGNLSCMQGTCYSCDPATEVEYNGRCYYLDGSMGQCDPGYELAPQSVLYTIRTWFAGKNYKHVVSKNCCIYNAEPDEDFGMQNHCNTDGPFTANDVYPGAAGCTDQHNFYEGQLTLCMSK